MRSFLIPMLGATLMLAACGRSEPDPAAVENNAADTVTNVATPTPTPTPTPEVENVVPPPVALPDLPDAQQMQDDADATGMTARLPDTGGNEEQPVQ